MGSSQLPVTPATGDPLDSASTVTHAHLFLHTLLKLKILMSLKVKDSGSKEFRGLRKTQSLKALFSSRWHRQRTAKGQPPQPAKPPAACASSFHTPLSVSQSAASEPPMLL